jgi:hypothetical protein
MIRLNPSDERKKLALQYILKNAEYRKRCLYLQEIISMSRRDDLWRKALMIYFDSPVTWTAFRSPCKN